MESSSCRLCRRINFETSTTVADEKRESGTQKIGISYLAGQIAWHCDYVALLGRTRRCSRSQRMGDGGQSSGTTFENAGLKLVAGDVNIPGNPMRSPQNRYSMRCSHRRISNFNKKNCSNTNCTLCSGDGYRTTKQSRSSLSCAARFRKKSFVYDGIAVMAHVAQSAVIS